MSTSPESVRVGIANNLSAVSGVTCSPWDMGLTAPSIQVVANGPVFYDRRGNDRLTFIIRAVVGTIDDIGAQRLLSTFVQASGSQSVKAAVERDRSLGNLVDDLRVTEYLGDKLLTSPNGVDYLVGEWAVEVLAPE